MGPSLIKDLLIWSVHPDEQLILGYHLVSLGLKLNPGPLCSHQHQWEWDTTSIKNSIVQLYTSI